jgi:hypothetical protein
MTPLIAQGDLIEVKTNDILLIMDNSFLHEPASRVSFTSARMHSRLYDIQQMNRELLRNSKINITLLSENSHISSFHTFCLLRISPRIARYQISYTECG